MSIISRRDAIELAATGATISAHTRDLHILTRPGSPDVYVLAEALNLAALRGGVADGSEMARENADYEPQPDGWAEAYILAMGVRAFGELCGLTEDETSDLGDAWRLACRSYDAGGWIGMRRVRAQQCSVE